METIYKTISDLANAVKYHENGDHCSKYNYLLGVTIREYRPDKKHTLISKGCKNEFESLTSKDINKCYGADTNFKCDRLKKPKKVGKFNNNKYDKPSEYIVINPNDVMTFNKLFIYEHVTTISDIKKAILDLDEITPETVKKLLDSKLYVCRLLKTENARIDNKYKSNRGLDINWIIKEVYGKADIEIL